MLSAPPSSCRSVIREAAQTTRVSKVASDLPWQARADLLEQLVARQLAAVQLDQVAGHANSFNCVACSPQMRLRSSTDRPQIADPAA